jgi:integrase
VLRGGRAARPVAKVFLGPGGKTLAPTTIGQLRITFITLASALVASGLPVDKLSSIATLVQPDNLKTALQFPARGGGHVALPLLTISIKRRARRHVGVEITCHQFRHLSAEIFLQADPLGLGVVSQHLGHRKCAKAMSRPRSKRRRKGSAP